MIRAGVVFSLMLVAAGDCQLPPSGNWFDYPDILCGTLAGLGFHAGAWKAVAPDSPVYTCEYPTAAWPNDTAARIAAEFAAKRPPPPTSLSFVVDGDRPNRAETVSIAITVHVTEAKADAKKQMLAYVQALFQTIRQDVPRALPAYIDKEQHYLSHQRYGVVSFFVTARRNEDVLWFRLGRIP